MSGWAKGDLALCVKHIDGQGVGEDIRAGALNTVEGVRCTSGGDLCLRFVGINQGHAVGYWAGKFRKINPLTEEQRRQALADLGEMVVVS